MSSETVTEEVPGTRTIALAEGGGQHKGGFFLSVCWSIMDIVMDMDIS